MEKDTGACDSIRINNLKVTPARRIIVEVFSRSPDQLFTAQEIYDLVRGRTAKTNFSTIYRNLETMTNKGLIEKISLEEGSKYKFRVQGPHGHHMICNTCHQTEPLPFCPLADLEKTLQEDSGFLPTKHRLEIYGYCRKCRESAEK